MSHTKPLINAIARWISAFSVASLLALAAVGALAPAGAQAALIPCPEPPCNIRPKPTPKPMPTYDVGVAEGYGERDFRDEHQKTYANLYISYRRSDNQPLRAFIKADTHAWNMAWALHWFISTTEVNLIEGGILVAKTSTHRLTVCPRTDPAGCNDRRDIWEEDIDLQVALDALAYKNQGVNVNLTVDVGKE